LHCIGSDERRCRYNDPNIVPFMPAPIAEVAGLAWH
jgi:hypothetical protein